MPMTLSAAAKSKLLLLGCAASAVAIPFALPLSIQTIPTISSILFVVLCAAFKRRSLAATLTFAFGFSIAYFITFAFSPLQSLGTGKPDATMEQLQWLIALVFLVSDSLWVLALPMA